MPRSLKSLNVNSNLRTKDDFKQEVERLSELAGTLYTQLQELQEKNEKAEAELIRLRAIVDTLEPEGMAEPTEEEEIALIQLKYLKSVAEKRPLTLDETRVFDILVKNKRLSQGKPTVNAAAERLKDLTPRQLLSVAKKDG